MADAWAGLGLTCHKLQTVAVPQPPAYWNCTGSLHGVTVQTSVHGTDSAIVELDLYLPSSLDQSGAHELVGQVFGLAPLTPRVTAEIETRLGTNGSSVPDRVIDGWLVHSGRTAESFAVVVTKQVP